MESSYLIDIAVLCQEYSKIDISCDNHITMLDPIEIKKEDFMKIFYPYGENFGLNKLIVMDAKYQPYISFHQTVQGSPFFLLEQIFKNVESDLNISRNCFTTDSRIELSNEFANINSLYNMNCCSVAASLPWSTVEEVIKNYSFNKNKKLTPIFVVSVCFKTPTPNVKDNIIQFHYKII